MCTFGRIGCRRISWIGLVEFERKGNGREWEESIVVEMVREVTEEETNLRGDEGKDRIREIFESLGQI